MKRIYNWLAQPANRNLTVADIIASKGKKKLTQVKVNSAEEAYACGEANIDMIVCAAKEVEMIREGNDEIFLTAALGIPEFPTETDMLKAAFSALSSGADAVMTARSLSVISLLANEDIPVMGHLGLVPRKCTWVGGIRAVGKTGDEAFKLFQQFKRLEDAGAFSVEAEVIPSRVMDEISIRTGLITVSLGSGKGGDVIYLFMEDICGEHKKAPKHARSFGNIYKFKELIKEERLSALKKFQYSSIVGEYPSEIEIAEIEDNEYDSFMIKLNS